MTKEIFENALSRMKKVPFWMLLLIMTSAEFLLAKPFGGIISAVIFAYWLFDGGNGARLIQKIRSYLHSQKTDSSNGSLWFDCEGKDSIEKIIDELSAASLSYCMLSDKLELPPTNEWAHISENLEAMGVRTQYSVSAESFYISWVITKD